MPQTVGKPKTKSSSTSKRHFTVVIGSKEHGLYCSSSPSSAARKAVSKLCGKEKGKKVEFCLREITQGSKKKTYGPYLGHIEKLAKPIQLKGRLVERTPVVELLKKKRSLKKGGMRGGGIEDITVSLGNCGRSTRIGFWKNGCITLIHGNNKVVLYYNEKTKNLEVRYFHTINNNVYIGEPLRYKLSEFNIFIFAVIIHGLIHSIKYTADNISQIIQTFNFTDNNNNIYTLIIRIVKESNMSGDLHCLMVIEFLNKLLQNNPQENERILQQQKETANKAQQIKNQEEKKIRNALEFERRAEEAKLAQAQQNELKRIQYRRILLASLPSATTKN
jgi:hypothetical protein